MADAQREVELKLALNPGDVARIQEHPALRRAAAGPAQIQHLRSVYFDTADLDLARAGMSLRLRSGGPQQIQTLKWGERESGGLYQRGELETAVDGERPDLHALPDEALRERVQALISDRELVPVFETDMRRTHREMREGADAWDVDLDEGEIRAGAKRERLCELELELREGDRARLYEMALELAQSFELWPGTRSKAERGYALRSGERDEPVKAEAIETPPDATLDAALRLIARSCLAQIASNAEGAWEGREPESLHQMRVGVRRMRSFFAVFRPVLPDEPSDLLEDHLRWLARELGSVRDLDVFVEDLLARVLALRRDDKALAAFRDAAEAMRDERKEQLRRALRSRRYTRLVLELGHWIERAAWLQQPLSERSALLFQRADVFAADALARLDRKAERLGREAIYGPPAVRHELRIALKKLRYVAEFFHSFFPKREVKRYLKRLERIQDLLGSLNDAETAARVLEEVLQRLEPGPLQAAQMRAAGFIEGFATRRDERAQDELDEQWGRFERVRRFWEPDA
jgi:inorganic triphosphatase YgiF